jgi:hypothetical protein
MNFEGNHNGAAASARVSNRTVEKRSGPQAHPCALTYCVSSAD